MSLCGKRYSAVAVAAAHFKTVNSLLQFGKARVTITTMHIMCVVCGMLCFGMIRSAVVKKWAMRVRKYGEKARGSKQAREIERTGIVCLNICALAVAMYLLVVEKYINRHNNIYKILIWRCARIMAAMAAVTASVLPAASPSKYHNNGHSNNNSSKTTELTLKRKINDKTIEKIKILN